MAQPTSYTRQYNFQGFQTSSPSDPLPAQYIDQEYNAIKTTLDEILTNLALIQRDDGDLANDSVGADQLVDSLVATADLTDLASTDEGEGASLIGVHDAGGIITATTVEAALVENRTAIDAAEAAIDDIEADYLTSSDILDEDDMASDSATKVPSQQSVKAYVDDNSGGGGGACQTVRAATTANITIATALNNGDTLDGVTLVTDDKVLVKDQSSSEENGVYVVGVTPARDSSFDAYDDHPGALITVQEGTTNADTVWQCTSNTGGTLDTTAIDFTERVVGIVPRGHFSGLNISNNGSSTTDVDIAAGECASDDTTPVLIQLATALTGKQADVTWAAGSSVGASLDSGAMTADGTLIWWAIAKADGTTDVACSDYDTSGLSPTLPTGYVYKRRIAAIPLGSGSGIFAFKQTGAGAVKRYMFKERRTVLDDTSPSTSRTVIALTVPVGIEVVAQLSATLTYNASNVYVIIFNATDDDRAPASDDADVGAAANSRVTYSDLERVTDDSGNVYYRASGTSVNAFKIYLIGWTDLL